MGLCLDSSEQMGEYSVVVRRESFILVGEDHDSESFKHPPDHSISVSPHCSFGDGAVEILIEDIPKIRACLDAVEANRY